MAQAKRRTVDPNPKPPEVVEFFAELTTGKFKMFGCPVCGRNGQDKEQIEQHIALHGGDA